MRYAVRVEGGWDDWRARARDLLVRRCPPGRIEWEDERTGQPSLLAREGLADDPGSGAPPTPDEPAGPAGPAAPFTVPRAFVTLGEAVACHADPERWALLYQALWRITGGERHLLDVAVDPLVHRLRTMEKQVRRDVHKMRAFVRFRRLEEEDGSERYVAWFEPAHDIVERNARFFVDRFAGMTWSILTPRRSLHWDQEVCWSGPGVSSSAAPGSDGLDDLWRTYYAHTYNPARTRWKAMVAEMPVRYWKNLPEARLIPLLVRDSTERVRGMLEREAADGPFRRRRGPRRWSGTSEAAQGLPTEAGPHGVAPWPDARGPHGPVEMADAPRRRAPADGADTRADPPTTGDRGCA